MRISWSSKEMEYGIDDYHGALETEFVDDYLKKQRRLSCQEIAARKLDD